MEATRNEMAYEIIVDQDYPTSDPKFLLQKSGLTLSLGRCIGMQLLQIDTRDRWIMKTRQKYAAGWLQKELQAAVREVGTWSEEMRSSTPASRYEAEASSSQTKAEPQAESST